MAKHSAYVFDKYNTSSWTAPRSAQNHTINGNGKQQNYRKWKYKRENAIRVSKSVVWFCFSSFTQTVRYTMILSSQPQVGQGEVKVLAVVSQCLWIFQMQLPHLCQPQMLPQPQLQHQCCCLRASQPGGREQLSWVKSLMLKCSTSYKITRDTVGRGLWVMLAIAVLNSWSCNYRPKFSNSSVERWALVSPS